MRKTRSNKIRDVGVTLLLAVCAAFSAGCAKIGDPQPPEIRIPKPAADLTAQQVADSIVLTVLKADPEYGRIGGHDAGKRRSVPASRGSEPGRRGKSSAGRPIRSDGPCASCPLRRPRFQDFLQGESFVIQDSPRIRGYIFHLFHAFRYALLFINKKNQAAGFSNQAFIAPVAIPLPPAGVSANVTEQIHTAEMDGARGKHGRIQTAAYRRIRNLSDRRIRRRCPLRRSIPTLCTNPNSRTAIFQFDQTYYYAIRIVGSSRRIHTR